MPIRTPLAAALTVAALLAAGPAAADSFVTFQIPGAVSLSPVKINSGGTVAGSVVIAPHTRGFVRTPDGTVTLFDVNGAETFVQGMSDDGTVVGSYQASDGQLHGFSRSPAGVISEVALPGADFVAPYGLNNAGSTLVGIYRESGTFTNLGFLAAGGSMVTIPPIDGSTGAVAVAVSDTGYSAGFYEYPQLPETGFVRAPDGTTTAFKAVQSAGPYTPQTEPAAVNDAGVVAGTYKALKCIENCRTVIAKGFVRDAAGQLTMFSVGGSRSKTFVSDLNNAGQVTGWADVPRQPQQGFIRNADGSVVSFSVPNMSYTAPSSINDAGMVTGSALSNSQPFGFVRTP
jgi:hypothetical protein